MFLLVTVLVIAGVLTGGVALQQTTAVPVTAPAGADQIRAQVVHLPPRTPLLSVTMRKVSPLVVQPGTTVQFDVAVHNSSTGTTLQNVVTSVPLPTGLTYLPQRNDVTGAGCSQQGTLVVCGPHNITRGPDRHYTLNVTVSKTFPCSATFIVQVGAQADNAPVFSSNPMAVQVVCTTPSHPASSCGNGKAEQGERCGEPGLLCPINQICQGCQCVYSRACGNGRIDSGEQCDPTAESFAPWCSPAKTGRTCSPTTCQCVLSPLVPSGNPSTR